MKRAMDEQSPGDGKGSEGAGSEGRDGEGAPSASPSSREPAQNLFGQIGGSRSGSARPERRSGERRMNPEAVSPDDPRQSASAPYPRDASYTPRPEVSQPDAPLDAVDDNGALTRLDPNYKLLMRIGALFVAFFVLLAGLIADAAIQAGGAPIPFGLVSVPAFIAALIIAIRVPVARFNARGYQMGADRLRVVRGVLTRSDTVVPFGRVQHIDVDQGPIERALSIATLTLHTAGSHNASVKLPGLAHADAVAMRETIRAHIKRESL
ncbi:PH domain-containing protein [Erythrobacter sp.]|jgi:membrane protein YdbS with pleckstrin-like domain|uniref:PH domain-containing protein n=1 Tax=Erythrobacter sp. TaxID=1042 RepID=UPI002EC10203|nr:PH domain-containing protein [Erythrobacter sp.]